MAGGRGLLIESGLVGGAVILGCVHAIGVDVADVATALPIPTIATLAEERQRKHAILRDAGTQARVQQLPHDVTSVRAQFRPMISRQSKDASGSELTARAKRIQRERRISFMVDAPLRLIRRVKGGVFLAGVNPSAACVLSARVLPNLPPPVPMKAKLRQLRRHVARLLALKLNPNPLADNLAQFPKARRFVVEQIQNLRCGKSPVLESQSEINLMQGF